MCIMYVHTLLLYHKAKYKPASIARQNGAAASPVQQRLQQPPGESSEESHHVY